MITRWDELISHAEYETARREVDVMFNSSTALQAAVGALASTFVKRGSDQSEAATALSTQYILEELAAFAILFQTPAAEIYPGAWIEDIATVISTLPKTDLFRGYHAIHFSPITIIKNGAVKK